MEIDKNIDNTMLDFNSRFDEIILALQKRLSVLVLEYLDEPLSLQMALNNALSELGYYKLIDDIINVEYDKNYDNILKLFGGFVLEYDISDLDIIRNLKALDLNSMLNISAEAIQHLQKDFYKYTISDMTKEQIVESLQESLQDTNLVKYSSTYVETAISTFNQNLIDLKSKDIPDNAVYLYRGVTDGKTRDFCRCLTGNHAYYNKAQAKTIKNDKRRKWNCRHLIVPVSLRYAEDNSYVKGSIKC